MGRVMMSLVPLRLALLATALILISARVTASGSSSQPRPLVHHHTMPRAAVRTLHGVECSRFRKVFDRRKRHVAILTVRFNNSNHLWTANGTSSPAALSRPFVVSDESIEELVTQWMERVDRIHESVVRKPAPDFYPPLLVLRIVARPTDMTTAFGAKHLHEKLSSTFPWSEVVTDVLAAPGLDYGHVIPIRSSWRFI